MIDIMILMSRPRLRECLAALAILAATASGGTGRAAAGEPPEVERLIENGRYDEAAAAAGALLEAAESEHGADSAEVATVLDHLVEARWRGGRLDRETVALAERALRIREGALGADHPDVARSLNSLGNVLLMSGKYARAEEVYSRALSIREKARGPEHPDVATSLNNLAQIQYVRDDYAGARTRLERALTIREKHFGPDHTKVAHVLNSLGRLLERQGELDGAKGCLTRALAVFEEIHGAGHIKVLSVKGDLASIMMELGDHEGAVPVLESLLEAQIETVGIEHPNTLHTMNNLGNALLRAGEQARAKRTFGRLLEIRQRVFPDHPFTASAMLNYGRLLVRDGRLDEARALYQRALTLRRRWNGEEHLTVASALAHLAALDLASGGIERAVERALQAEGIAREQFQEIAASLSESEALRFERIRASGLDVAISALVRSEGDLVFRVWDHLARSRSMVLDEIAARRRQLTLGAEGDVGPLVEELTAARNELARLLVSGTGAEREDYLEELVEARERRRRAERRLAQKSSELRRRQARRKTGLGEIVAALPEETALVAYARYRGGSNGSPGADELPEAHYLAFVLGGADARPSIVPLGPAERIDDAIRRWKEQAGRRPPTVPLAARQAEARYRVVGGRLRRLLWDPVVPHVGDSRQLILVPEGSIHLVSFASLPSGQEDYLVEVGPVLHHLSAERDIARTGRRERGRGLLAVGGPDFGVPKARVPRGVEELGVREFMPLHASRIEVEEVAALWKRTAIEPSDVRVLTGEEASEAAVRSLSKGRQVLHLATHGFFVRDRSERVEEPAGRILDDPLLRSGLALAGANTRHERDSERAERDGILTAEEVATLDLSALDWVVLSACETGLGEVQVGEGVLGVRRAFETAGVGTLIMSLWAVEDESTRDWMSRLYRHRLGGMTTARAVREATVESLAARRRAGQSSHPFYWGAFAAFGDWR